MEPGLQKGMPIVVADVGACGGSCWHTAPTPARSTFSRGFVVTFSDPDGNTWALQELPPWP